MGTSAQLHCLLTLNCEIYSIILSIGTKNLVEFEEVVSSVELAVSSKLIKNPSYGVRKPILFNIEMLTRIIPGIAIFTIYPTDFLRIVRRININSESYGNYTFQA